MSKILIEVSGGSIQRILSSEDLEVIIIDHDNIDAGDPPVVQTSPDQIMIEGTFHEAFLNEGDTRSMEVYAELKDRGL
jgi:hypothetical protein